MPSADRGGSCVGWVLARALILVVSSTAVPAIMPPVDETARILSGTKDVNAFSERADMAISVLSGSCLSSCDNRQCAYTAAAYGTADSGEPK